MPDLSDVVGAAASGLNPVSSLVSLGKDLIERFVPDPAAKLQASQHLVDMQSQLQLAQLDAETKEIQATAGANNDHYLGGVRAYFCFAVTTLFIWNWGLGPVFKHPPVDIPGFVVATFATIMLGFVGVPAGIEMAKQIAGMPGDSQVSLLGVKVGNKS